MIRTVDVFTLVAGIVFVATSGCRQPPRIGPAAESPIRLNQVGFLPHGPKVAVIASIAPHDSFFVKTLNGKVVFEGALSDSKRSPSTEELVQLADFSTLTAPGMYRLGVRALRESHPFEVSADVYSEVARITAKALYYNRASTSLPEAHAGQWMRSAGHPDTAIVIHASAARDGLPAGAEIASPRGWYDAGDYNKYIVPAAYTSYFLLASYEDAQQVVENLSLNIPESGNRVPDILDEAVWNLRWMLTMQDEDGGLYHKLTHAAFSGVVMPEYATQTRYVLQKSTAASLTFAAAMAQAARVLSGFASQMPGLADSCRAAALRAWQWAAQNPDVFYRQGELNERYDPDISTGAYGDENLQDERYWASIELFLLTGDPDFYPAARPDDARVPYWEHSVSLLGDWSMLRRGDAGGETFPHREVMLQVADEELTVQASSAYRVPVERDEDFYWGANGTAATKAGVLLQAFRLTDDLKYRDAAIDMLDYLLGRNATTYSFVTGLGERSPMHIHHRQSEADGIADPVPGWLAGGPGAVGAGDCPEYPSNLRALHYLDEFCSYSTNEVATYWNAPLVHAAVLLQAGN